MAKLQVFAVTTKSHLGENSALNVNSVKRQAFKKASKNQKTACARGVLIDGVVPKGGIDSPSLSNLFLTKAFLLTG